MNKNKSDAASFERLLSEIKNKHPFVVDIFYNAHMGTWDMNTELDGVNEFDTFENAFKRIKYLAKELEAINLGLIGGHSKIGDKRSADDPIQQKNDLLDKIDDLRRELDSLNGHKDSIGRHKSTHEGLHREFEIYESFHSILYDEEECAWKVWMRNPDTSLYYLLFDSIQGAHEYLANLEKQ